MLYLTDFYFIKKTIYKKINYYIYSLISKKLLLETFFYTTNNLQICITAIHYPRSIVLLNNNY